MQIFTSLSFFWVYLVKGIAHNLWVGFILRCLEDISEFCTRVRHNLIDVRHHRLERG